MEKVISISENQKIKRIFIPIYGSRKKLGYIYFESYRNEKPSIQDNEPFFLPIKSKGYGKCLFYINRIEMRFLDPSDKKLCSKALKNGNLTGFLTYSIKHSNEAAQFPLDLFLDENKILIDFSKIINEPGFNKRLTEDWNLKVKMECPGPNKIWWYPILIISRTDYARFMNTNAFTSVR